MLDRLSAIILLIILLPLLGLISVLILVFSGRPILYQHRRCGYKFDEFYYPEDQRCLLWNDPEVNIDWPLSTPKLSDKDLRGKKLRELI